MAQRSTNALFEQAGEALASSSPFAKQVMDLCIEADTLGDNIAQLEELLKSAKARANIIKTKDLPEALSQLGTSEWKSENGRYEVSVDSFVSGTLPKDEEERKKATDWIAEHGGAALIKTEIKLDFGKQEHAAAVKAEKALKKAGFEPTIQTGVHPQSLLAFARELLEDGEDVDFAVLGLYSGRQAKMRVNDPEKKAAAKAARAAKTKT